VANFSSRLSSLKTDRWQILVIEIRSVNWPLGVRDEGASMNPVKKSVHVCMA
jgi:hypothetical protein